MNRFFLTRQCAARPLACGCLAFFAGMVICTLGFAFSLPLLLAAAACAALYGVLRKRVRGAFLLLLTAALLCGGVRMQARLDAMQPIRSLYRAQIVGTAIDEPEYRAATDRLIVPLRLELLNGKPIEGKRVRLYLRGEGLHRDRVHYGQRLLFTGNVWAADAPDAPYAFNQQRWLMSNGFHGMASAEIDDVECIDGPRDVNALRIDLRRAVSRRIDALFPRQAELVKAFVLGDRSELDEDLRSEFGTVGIAHLICISGMHITVVAMALGALLSKLFSRNAAVLLTGALVLLYGFLIGYPVSLVRASIMYLVLSFAPLFGRPSDAVTRLCFALMLMLLIEPLDLYKSGLQLSFTASAGLILLNEPISALFGVDRLGRIRRKGVSGLLLSALCYFAQLFCASLAAQLGTLPFVIASYGAQSALSLVANLFAVPVAMLAYPLALSALLVSRVVLPLGAAAATVSDWMFSLLPLWAHELAALPVGVLRIPRFPLVMVVLYYVLLAACSPLSAVKIELRRFLPLATVGFVGVSMLSAWLQALPCEVVFFNNGGADTALLSGNGQNYIVDVGDEYSPAIDIVAASRLSLDGLFVLGEDAWTGFDVLVKAQPPKRIYLPDGEAWAPLAARAEALNIPVVPLRDGDVLELGESMTVAVSAANGDGELLLNWTMNGTRVLFGATAAAQTLPEAELLCLREMKKTDAPPTLPETVRMVIRMGEENPSAVETDRPVPELYPARLGAVTVRLGEGGEMHYTTFNTKEVS